MSLGVIRDRVWYPCRGVRGDTAFYLGRMSLGISRRRGPSARGTSCAKMIFNTNVGRFRYTCDWLSITNQFWYQNKECRQLRIIIEAFDIYIHAISLVSTNNVQMLILFLYPYLQYHLLIPSPHTFVTKMDPEEFRSQRSQNGICA
jgi:hypothetical protein